MSTLVAGILKIGSHPEYDGIQGDGLGYHGVFSRDSLSRGLPADFLAGELLHRLSEEERITMFGEAFILASMRGNDDAAAVFLENFHLFLCQPGCHLERSMQFGREEYKDSYNRSYAKGVQLFEVIQCAYWKSPLYGWKSDGPLNRIQVNRLQKTKKLLFSLVAQLWGGVNDNLGERAFWFLCDACDKAAIMQKAALFAAETSERKKSNYPEIRPEFYFEMPKEDVDAVLQAMRPHTPSGMRSEDEGIIKVWLRKMSGSQPVVIRRHLGHAYVNAGGLIVG
jgi:hypothetical protein